jgi:hypothetical protein
VLYTVQVFLSGDKLVNQISDVQEWIQRRQINQNVFRYSMADEDVLLRLDFNLLNDATSFAEAFGGRVCAGNNGVEA